jgi:hypothetical protein
MTCCSAMEFYVSGWSGGGRFTDPACLIHVSQAGDHGIIVHDGSGRYSIIKFCPWCGEPLTEEARILTRGNVSAEAYALLEEPRHILGLAPLKVESAEATHFPRPPRRRSAPGKSSKVLKGRHVRTPEQRRALSVKLRAIFAEKKRLGEAAALVSSTQEEQDNAG